MRIVRLCKAGHMSWQKDVRKRCEQEEGRTEQACTTQEGPEQADIITQVGTEHKLSLR